MTKQEEHLKELNETVRTISLQTFEDCDLQGMKVAANMIMNYGDSAVITAQGFIQAMVQSLTLGLTWLVTDGYVTLTDKGKADEAELKERAEKRKKHHTAVTLQSDESVRTETIGMYL